MTPATKVTRNVIARLALSKDREGAMAAMEAALLRGDFTTAASLRATAAQCLEQEMDLLYQMIGDLRKEVGL